MMKEFHKRIERVRTGSAGTPRDEIPCSGNPTKTTTHAILARREVRILNPHSRRWKDFYAGRVQSRIPVNRFLIYVYGLPLHFFQDKVFSFF
jgi:hypothetical protein